MLAHFLGEEGRAVGRLEEGLALWRDLQDLLGVAWALLVVGVVAEDRGDYDEAVPLLEEALSLFQDAGYDAFAAQTRYHLGVVAYGRGEHEEAVAILDAAVSMCRDLGDRWGIAIAFGYLALVLREQGDVARAASFNADALAMQQEIGNKEDIARCVANAAVLAVARGHPEAAVRLFGAAESLCRTIGLKFRPPEQSSYERADSAARAALSEPAFAAAWSQGLAMATEHAIAQAKAIMAELASEVRSTKLAAPGGPHRLTPRELEILRLLVEGHSDREIARSRFVSHRTVQTHVANILQKLGVNTRAEAAAWAVRHGLA
jgi:non-specific serine/threonine protein kinase